MINADAARAEQMPGESGVQGVLTLLRPGSRQGAIRNVVPGWSEGPDPEGRACL